MSILKTAGIKLSSLFMAILISVKDHENTSIMKDILKAYNFTAASMITFFILFTISLSYESQKESVIINILREYSLDHWLGAEVLATVS